MSSVDDIQFIESRSIPNYSVPLRIYRAASGQMMMRHASGAPDEPLGDPFPETLLFSVSFGMTGLRYTLSQLRAILAVAEQAETELTRPRSQENVMEPDVTRAIETGRCPACRQKKPMNDGRLCGPCQIKFSGPQPAEPRP